MERPPFSPPFPAVAPPSDRALLERIEAKLDRIEARLARLDSVVEAAPGVLAIVGDTFDEWAAQTGDVDDRVRALVRVVERITRPDTLAQVERALDLLEQLPGFVAMAGDVLDDLAKTQTERGVDVEKLLHDLGRTVKGLLRLISSEQVQRLFESDLLLPGAVQSLDVAARALAAAHAATEQRIGLLGALRSLRDPDVQRALGFALDVARRFGHALGQPPAADRLDRVEALPAATGGE